MLFYSTEKSTDTELLELMLELCHTPSGSGSQAYTPSTSSQPHTLTQHPSSSQQQQHTPSNSSQPHTLTQHSSSSQHQTVGQSLINKLRRSQSVVSSDSLFSSSGEQTTSNTTHYPPLYKQLSSKTSKTSLDIDASDLEARLPENVLNMSLSSTTNSNDQMENCSSASEFVVSQKAPPFTTSSPQKKDSSHATLQLLKTLQTLGVKQSESGEEIRRDFDSETAGAMPKDVKEPASGALLEQGGEGETKHAITLDQERTKPLDEDRINQDGDELNKVDSQLQEGYREPALLSTARDIPLHETATRENSLERTVTLLKQRVCEGGGEQQQQEDNSEAAKAKDSDPLHHSPLQQAVCGDIGEQMTAEEAGCLEQDFPSPIGHSSLLHGFEDGDMDYLQVRSWVYFQCV